MAAAFQPSANGRNIISAHDTSFAEIAKILRDKFGNAYPLPSRTMPKWLVWLMAPSVDKNMTRKIVSTSETSGRPPSEEIRPPSKAATISRRPGP
jgi:dihydroflavonol-4-reductase